MKILAALSRFPYPGDKGDKLRAYHQLKYLAQHNEVHLFCLSDEYVKKNDLEHLQSIFTSVTVFQLKKSAVFARLFKNVFQKKPFQIAYFTDNQAKEQFDELKKTLHPDLIFCQLARMAEYVRDYTDVQKCIDYQDAFSKGLQRRLAHNAFYKRVFIRIEFKRLRAYEVEIFKDFHQHTIISAQDANFFPADQRNKLIIVPNGIDSEYFKPADVSKKYDLLFTGNMQYEPNVNCVHYIINKVLPHLHDKYPSLFLVAAGVSPAASLKRAEGNQLKLTGWVEDLREYYAQSRIFIAPLQISIGMQNKILEAMSMGLPVITSTLSNNPIGAKHGRDLIIADTPFDCATAIDQLLSEPDLAKQMGINARIFIERKYKWEKQNARLPFVYVETV